MVGSETPKGLASSLTEASPRANRASMPRRVESLNAAKVASNEGRVYLAMWISINPGGGRVKWKGTVREAATHFPKTINGF
jgi:hypothetical protein